MCDDCDDDVDMEAYGALKQRFECWSRYTAPTGWISLATELPAYNMLTFVLGPDEQSEDDFEERILKVGKAPLQWVMICSYPVKGSNPPQNVVFRRDGQVIESLGTGTPFSGNSHGYYTLRSRNVAALHEWTIELRSKQSTRYFVIGRLGWLLSSPQIPNGVSAGG